MPGWSSVVAMAGILGPDPRTAVPHGRETSVGRSTYPERGIFDAVRVFGLGLAHSAEFSCRFRPRGTCASLTRGNPDPVRVRGAPSTAPALRDLFRSRSAR